MAARRSRSARASPAPFFRSIASSPSRTSSTERPSFDEDARRGGRHERHEGPRNGHGRDDSGPRKERPGLGPVRDLGRAQDRRGDREEHGGGERPRERREGRQPGAAREALDDLLGVERPVVSLEREPRARLEKEKAVAADAREERQSGGVGRDLERVARGLERRVALCEELLDLGPLAHESTRERHEGRLVGGVCRVDDGHGAAEEPRERRRERLEEGLSPVRGRERRDRLPVRRPRETGRGLRDEGLHVDADRERSDGRPVSREGGGVGAEVHRAVRPRQDEPRDLHEIVVLGRAPERGARGRAR